MSNIAIIGFGSLIWDLESLATSVRGGWKMYAGPLVPIEFSLVSKKRLGALALVIDEDHGTPCPTCVIESTHTDLQAAIHELARRERTAEDTIGFFDRSNGERRAVGIHTAGLFENWIESTTYDAVIWTDGESNFLRTTGSVFSLPAAREYLLSLDVPARREAQRYLRNAPKRVDTPLRQTSLTAGWWATD